MKRFHYNVIFRPEPEGGFTVSVPSLSGCISYGRNLIEARKNILDAINGYLASMIKHNREQSCHIILKLCQKELF